MDTSADPRPAAERAVDTELISRLDADWRMLVGSRRFRTQLYRWGLEDPRLAFHDADALVAAARQRGSADWHARDQILAALLERLPTDPVARRVALQVVMPGVVSLIDGVRGWDVEERASRVVTEAVEVLARCAQADAGTAPNFRVFANTRRRVLRAAIRDRSEPVTPAGFLSDMPNPSDPAAASGVAPDEKTELGELIEWVQTEGGLRSQLAAEVVLTRTGAVDIDELAAVLGVAPTTLRQRRRRAERRLGHSLTIKR